MPPDFWFAQSPFVQSLVPRLTDLASGWLLTYLVHSTVILIVAWIVTSRTRVSESVRDVIWKCALVGGIVTATLQTAVAREPLGGQLRLASRTAPPPAAMRISIRGDLPTSKPRIMLARPRGIQWSAALVIVWLTGSGAGLLWLTIAHARTLRVLADRTPLECHAAGDPPRRPARASWRAEARGVDVFRLDRQPRRALRRRSVPATSGIVRAGA